MYILQDKKTLLELDLLEICSASRDAIKGKAIFKDQYRIIGNVSQVGLQFAGCECYIFFSHKTHLSKIRICCILIRAGHFSDSARIR